MSHVIKRILGEAEAENVYSLELRLDVLAEVNVDAEQSYDETSDTFGPGFKVNVLVSIDDNVSPSAYEEDFDVKSDWEPRLRKQLSYFFQKELDAPYRVYSDEAINKIVELVKRKLR